MPSFSNQEPLPLNISFKNNQEKVEHFNNIFKVGDNILAQAYGQASHYIIGKVFAPAFLDTKYDVGLVQIIYMKEERQFVPIDSVRNWYGKVGGA